MKIRNIIVVLSLLIAITTNAQKNTKTEVPAIAQQFLTEQFSKQTIASVTENPANSRKGFIVTLSDNTEIEFKKDGRWRAIDGKGKEIPSDLVVQPILDYSNKNYPKQKITKIEYGLSQIQIKLSNKVNLEFDKNGKFVKID